jgi:hypothetical protein
VCAECAGYEILKKGKEENMAPYRSDRRELIQNVTGTYFAKRRENGQFKAMDELHRSLSDDDRRQAKRTVRPGFGDTGDGHRRKR